MTGPVAVRSLAYVTLEVSDASAAVDFASSFGFTTLETGHSIRLLCPGRDQDQVVLVEGGGPLLESLTFTVAPGELGNFQDRLSRAKICEVDGPGPGAWCVDPHGNRVQVIEATPAPSRQLDPWKTNIGGRYERLDAARWVGVGGRTTPRRLGHALIFTPDLPTTEAWYIDTLGLRLSDRIPGAVSFLNAGAGDHHVFGCIASSAPGFHHASFEVDDLDALGIGIEQLHGSGFSDGWGLGRHTLGSNFFYYSRTPFGPLFEYFCDIDQISDKWESSDYEVRPWVWGSPPPADFLANSSAS